MLVRYFNGFIPVSLDKLNINAKVSVRDLWKHENLTTVEDEIIADIPPHGAILYQLNNI